MNLNTKTDPALAEAIATRAHAEVNQVRFDGSPYIEHPRRVANRIINGTFENVPDHWRAQAICVAWLHDVLEDTNVTRAELEAQFPSQIVEAVAALTKTEGVDYMEYLRKVKETPLARYVKIADMLDNLSDSPSKKQVKKYSTGLAFLLGLS